MAKTNRRTYDSGDALPIEAKTENDATEELTGRQLKHGLNPIMRGASGLELVIKTEPGRLIEYLVLDGQGNPVDEVIQVRVQNRKTKKTTCWECGVDAEGNRHCWKVACPVIVGPWDIGKVMQEGLRFE